MVAPWKIEEVKRLKELINSHKVVGLVEFFEMPAAQIHMIRQKFRGKVLIKMSKKRLIERALKETGKEELSKLVENIKMPALIFTNEDPIKIFKEIMKFKAPAPAKEGVAAPKDIVIPAGPTDLPPTAMGLLKKFGIKCKVEGGKISIIEEKTVLKKGEVITKELVEILNKLGIKPLEISLNIVALYDGKVLFDREALELSLKDFSEDLKKAFEKAFYLALGIGEINKYTARSILMKAYLNAMALCSSIVLPVEESLRENIKKAYRIASVLKGKLEV